MNEDTALKEAVLEAARLYARAWNAWSRGEARQGKPVSAEVRTAMMALCQTARNLEEERSDDGV